MAASGARADGEAPPRGCTSIRFSEAQAATGLRDPFADLRAVTFRFSFKASLQEKRGDIVAFLSGPVAERLVDTIRGSIPGIARPRAGAPAVWASKQAGSSEEGTERVIAQLPVIVEASHVAAVKSLADAYGRVNLSRIPLEGLIYPDVMATIVGAAKPWYEITGLPSTLAPEHLPWLVGRVYHRVLNAYCWGIGEIRGTSMKLWLTDGHLPAEHDFDVVRTNTDDDVVWRLTGVLKAKRLDERTLYEDLVAPPKMRRGTRSARPPPPPPSRRPLPYT